MAFDFKKEYKEFYMPKNKPEMDISWDHLRFGLILVEIVSK